MHTIDEIREAICKNRGGWENESNRAIMKLWNSLTPQVRRQYLDSIKKDGDKDAVSFG